MKYDNISIGDFFVSGDIVRVHEDAPEPIKWALFEISENTVRLFKIRTYSFQDGYPAVKVKDVHKITKEEFDIIWPGHWNVTQWSAKEFNNTFTVGEKETEDFYKRHPEMGPYSKIIETKLPVSQAVLTKRELIAAMALQGILSSGRWFKATSVAVEQADDLLKKLNG